MTTLYRSKDNGRLYRLFIKTGGRPGMVTAKPFGHCEELNSGTGGLRLVDFEPEQLES